MESREMGLPVQDADYQFIDEGTPSSTIASGMDESVVTASGGQHHQQQQRHDAEDGHVVDYNEVEDEEEQVEHMGASPSKNTEEVEGGVVVERVDGNDDMEKMGDDEDDSIVSC